MNPIERQRRLTALAAMKSDQALAALQAASAARNRTLEALAQLDSASQRAQRDAGIELSAGGDAAAALRADAFGHWAMRQRMQLNPRLARETAAWLEAQAGAAQAFGRKDVTQALLRQGLRAQRAARQEE